MGAIVYILILALTVLLSAGLLKAYFAVPLRELRRQARAGDSYAKAAYSVANYGRSAELFLWSVGGLSASLLFFKLSRQLEWWVALVLVFVFLLFVYWWVPNKNLKNLNKKVAIVCAPAVAKLLSLLLPPLRWMELKINRFMPITLHSGLYEKEDLVDLLDKQATQPDSRISEQEIEIAKNALSFSDKLVRDVMTPRRMMKTLMSNEQISPHLLDEIHSSGYSRLPVFERDEDGQEQVVGILYTKDLIDAVHSGSIGGVMDRKIYYTQEELGLSHALDAFLKTKHHLFVVVNKFEEIVGVISIEDIIEQILGRQIVDEFDAYSDLRAVAGLEAKKQKQKRADNEPQPTENTDEKVVE